MNDNGRSRRAISVGTLNNDFASVDSCLYGLLGLISLQQRHRQGIDALAKNPPEPTAAEPVDGSEHGNLEPTTLGIHDPENQALMDLVLGSISVSTTFSRQLATLWPMSEEVSGTPTADIAAAPAAEPGTGNPSRLAESILR